MNSGGNNNSKDSNFTLRNHYPEHNNGNGNSNRDNNGNGNSNYHLRQKLIH